MTKFNKGDIVIGLDNNGYSITTAGWMGKVVDARIETIRVRQCDKKGIFSGKTDVWTVDSNKFKLYKAMAKKKSEKELPIVVKDGDYFSATYNRKKIRGVVENVGSNEFPELRLNNSQGVGEEVVCADDYKFPYYLELREDVMGTAKDLKDIGVTNYVVLKDKRQKAIIDKDKPPVLETGGGEWKVKIVGKDVFSFGCGNVELTRKQIEGYLRIRNSIPANYRDLKESDVQDCTIEELEAYVAYEKIKKAGKGDAALYLQVIKACEDEIEEDDINQIPESTIKELFKYMDWINRKE